MSSFSPMSAVWLLVVAALLGAPMGLARGVSVASDSPFADRLRVEIENFRNVMKNGATNLGIPTLDPLSVPRVPINVQSSMLKAVGSLNDVLVSSASAFTVTKLEQTSANGNSARISIAVEVPTVGATTVYDLNGKVKVSFITVKLSGQSPVSVSISGITANLDVDLTINNDNSLTVDSISNVNFNIDKIKVKVNKMSGVVNKLINQLVPNLIKSNRDKIIELTETKGKDLVNKYFNLIAGKKIAAPALSVATALETLSSQFIVSPEAERLLERIALQLKLNSVA